MADLARVPWAHWPDVLFYFLGSGCSEMGICTAFAGPQPRDLRMGRLTPWRGSVLCSCGHGSYGGADGAGPVLQLAPRPRL